MWDAYSHCQVPSVGQQEHGHYDASYKAKVRTRIRLKPRRLNRGQGTGCQAREHACDGVDADSDDKDYNAEGQDHVYLWCQIAGKRNKEEVTATYILTSLANP